MEKDCRTWWRKEIDGWEKYVDKCLDKIDEDVLSVENGDCITEQFYAIREGLA